MATSKGGRRSLLVLFLTVFIDLVGFGMVIPLLPFYGAQFGATPGQIGLLAGVYSFMQFLMAPMWGTLSDRYGRRPILLTSLFGIACAYLWFSSAQDFETLFLARALAGLCAANISTAVAYVADVTSIEDRAKGMGLIGAAFGLGFVFGPALGGIAGQHQLMLPPKIAAVLSLTAFLLALVALPESRDTSSKGRELGFKPLINAFKDPGLSKWMYSYLFYMLAVASMEVALPLLVKGAPFDYDPKQNGLLFMYSGIVVALVQGGAIRRMKGGREAQVSRGGAILSIVGLVLLPLSGNLALLLVALTFLALGQGLTQPTLMALISRSAAAEEQGTVMGVSQSLASFGRIVGPPLAGYMYGAWRGGPFYADAVFVVIVILLIGAAHRLSPTPADRVPQMETV